MEEKSYAGSVKPVLSLVVPTRNEGKNVVKLALRIACVLRLIRYELIFVDDSDDDTPLLIKGLIHSNGVVRLVHRKRNERAGGLATAVIAGFQQASGAYTGAVEPDDPEPLDTDLPTRPAMMGKRGRRFLWVIAALALAARLILLPLGHPWDLTTAYNMFIDIGTGHSPYDTFRYLSNVAYSAHWNYAYEYYAYPPMPLYIYSPLARLFLLLHPHMTYFFPLEGPSSSLPNLPWDFYLWYKLPVWIADFLIAALLARMSGTIRGWRDYLLNPYVLLVSGAWTFDAIMVLGLVAGVYWLQQGKFTRSALALAFGTMVKFFPIIVVPTSILFLIKKKRRLREIALFLGVYIAACFLTLGPYLNGVLDALSFHATRPGGGMTWQVIFLYPQVLKALGITNVPPLTLHVLSAFGTPILAILLLLAYWYGFTRAMSFNRMILVTLLAFYIGSKLVNEQYALMMLPFAFIEARQVGGAWRWFYRLFWIIPLAYASTNVPLDRFLLLFYHTVFGARADVIATTGATGFDAPILLWNLPTAHVGLLVVLGLAFSVMSIVAILWPIRPAKRHYRRAPDAPSPSDKGEKGTLAALVPITQDENVFDTVL